MNAFYQPGADFQNVTVSDTGYGEIRLKAIVEDYFNDNYVDPLKWVSGSIDESYQVLPNESDGFLTLDSSFIRSRVNLKSYPNRFFEGNRCRIPE
jgi:hypothetical protein